MGVPAILRSASRFLSVLSLVTVALLSLQSCKNHTSPAGNEAREGLRGEPRAVFGERPGVPAEKRSRLSDISPTPRTPTERAAQLRDSLPKQEARTGGRNRSRQVDIPSGADQSAVLTRQQASNRFLYYRPPGARIGDTGEIGQEARSSPPSTSSIRGLIYHWADTLVSGNLDAHMALYAPSLDRFQGLSNVSRDSVRDDRQRLMRSFSGVRRFEIHDLRISNTSEDTAAADFRLMWSAGAYENASSVSHRLQLRRIGNAWKIAGEERLRLITRYTRDPRGRY
jgi:hypothetical protein